MFFFVIKRSSVIVIFIFWQIEVWLFLPWLADIFFFLGWKKCQLQLHTRTRYISGSSRFFFLKVRLLCFYSNILFFSIFRDKLIKVHEMIRLAFLESTILIYIIQKLCITKGKNQFHWLTTSMELLEFTTCIILSSKFLAQNQIIT